MRFSKLGINCELGFIKQAIFDKKLVTGDMKANSIVWEFNIDILQQHVLCTQEHKRA